MLAQYRHVKEFKAENGAAGMKNSMHGKDGEDLYIDLPVGSVIKNLETGKVVSLDEEGQTVRLLIGGRGGLGNEHYKSSTNVNPMQSTDGRPGESADFFIELELIADIGLIGLPNAGKSSLLNELTNSTAKIGAYAFTTLEPNLGDMYGKIIADIPGLIEGASEGKGLGHAFLRHVRRTRLLAHCISLENEDLKAAYKVIRDELEAYSSDLAKKPEIIVLTKSDVLADAKKIAAAKKQLASLKREIVVVSTIDPDSIKLLRDTLSKHFVVKSFYA